MSDTYKLEDFHVVVPAQYPRQNGLLNAILESIIKECVAEETIFDNKSDTIFDAWKITADKGEALRKILLKAQDLMVGTYDYNYEDSKYEAEYESFREIMDELFFNSKKSIDEIEEYCLNIKKGMRLIFEINRITSKMAIEKGFDPPELSVPKQRQPKEKKITPIFEGELNRRSLSTALKAVMQEKGLSVRKAADAANIGAGEIQRIGREEATLDKAAEVLSELGYELHVEVRRIDSDVLADEDEPVP
ncbi:hypothetical protein FIV00_00080 [Labrenzia sp. THAF82]|uniref:hypothetical protein n=1 Tax=Labrenzia sp. THAF82 TaxID=2587861 RepID=UPI001268A5B3|nr:hypothetical protein [Labrenzia sp. THAF82]QFT28871.1 hypothetical protein FIV00_00080 [Labrenzia sp. THAF82]